MGFKNIIEGHVNEEVKLAVQAAKMYAEEAGVSLFNCICLDYGFKAFFD